jgi:hypothetical protein
MAQCPDVVNLRGTQQVWSFLTDRGTVVVSRSLLQGDSFGSRENTISGSTLSIEVGTNYQKPKNNRQPYRDMYNRRGSLNFLRSDVKAVDMVSLCKDKLPRQIIGKATKCW